MSFNIDRFVEVLLMVVRDPAHLHRLADEAEIAKRVFSVEAIGDKWDELIQEELHG